jgi:hypothetical protein
MNAIAKVYRNDGGGVFTDIGAGLTGVYDSSVAWGDYDNDGDLEILLTGNDSDLSSITKVYRNDAATANVIPGAPASLAATVDLDQITLSWAAASDTETPPAGLTYNLRVGTSPGASDVMSPMAAGSGHRLIPAMGNAQHGVKAILKSLPLGTYYWSVQAIDSAFAGSAFPAGRSFERPLTQAAALTLTPLSQGVLKAGDTVEVQPSWRNNGSGATGAMTGSGTASNGGTIVDGAASYGVVAPGGTAACAAESDCYWLTASGPRPANHWDVKLDETLSEPGSHEWLLHVGDSFSDVPSTSGYFRFIETLYHKSVTGGCTATTYCPGNSATRGQMAIFALVGKEGAAYSPVPCGTTPMFADVAVTSPYCKWVEELARRGVVGGCGGGNYCPTNAVTRGQMAIFMLKTLDPALNPHACGTPMFGDVPATSAYCKWIEELARRGVVSGCGGGNYCPTSPVTRGQMGVFISATFGLTLYGP